MNCPKCSQPVPDQARFCAGCGQPLDAGTGGAPGGAAAAAGAVPFPGAQPASAAGQPLAGLVQRIRNIVLAPRTEWPVIEPEPTSVAQLYSGYVVYLAGFAAVMSFIRMSVIGVALPFGGYLRTPLVNGLMTSVVTFAFGLLGLFLVGLIINALAPTFEGRKDARQALKTAAYAFTPAWLSTVLTFLPLGGLLQFLAGLYGIYVLYLGLPVMMRSKPERAVGYTAAVVVCTIIVGVIFGFIAARFGGASRWGGFGGSATSYVDPNTPEGRAEAADRGAAVLGNVIGGALGTDEKGKAGLAGALANLAKAGQQMEEQQRAGSAGGTPAAGTAAAGATSAGTAAAAGPTGSPAATANAVAATGGLLTALGGALGGSHRVEPVDFNTLKEMLPASLPQMERTHAEGSRQQAMGVTGTSATAEYQGTGGAHMRIKIADISGVAGLVDAASGLVPTEQSESDSGYEKSAVVNGRQVHEKYDRASSSGEVDIIVAKRFAVEVTGESVDMPQLERTLGNVDLARLESLKDAGATAN